MSSNWLFLRGFWDKNNKKSLIEDSDCWLQLFEALVDECDNTQEANGCIYYHGYKQKIPLIYNGCMAVAEKGNVIALAPRFDYVFARGGHPEYEPILKKCKNAHITYYGAGARIVPEKDLGYNLILCDTEEQVEKCKEKYPHIKASTWIKPAAKHFKPIECEKEYDACYVANCHSKFQEKIKRVKWVYKTVPSDLKVLHLGKSSIKPPKNVTVKQVSRLEMPKWYSKCMVGIVPYKGYDSAPRVIPEMLACGLSLTVVDSVNFWRDEYLCDSPTFNGFVASKKNFWRDVVGSLNGASLRFVSPVIQNYYQEYLSLKPAAEHLRKLIHG